MTNFSMKHLPKLLSVTVFAVATLFVTTTGFAQSLHTVQPRILAPIDDRVRTAVHGMSPGPMIQSSDLGKLDPSMKVEGMTLMFSRTLEQEADLQGLIAAQQNPNSPLYHQWLEPEEFGARFGMHPDDIAKVQIWLQHEGFTIGRVARAGNSITFSGNEALIESAFGTELHNFKLPDGSVHFAPAADLTFPTPIANNILFVRGLNTFRHKAHNKRRVVQSRPNFTASPQIEGSNYFLTSADLAVEYDANGAYKAGYTGSGQSVVVVGVSSILQSDISTYKNAAGIPQAKPPITILVPSSGAPFASPGDQGEADLDLEYSSTIAYGAQVYYVYTGYNYNNGTDDAIAMSIDDKIAPVITSSYGDCETYIDLEYDGTTYFTAQDAVYAQGVAQGQTIMESAGDDGSTDCYEYLGTGLTLTQTEAPAVEYPASSPYVLAVGGTGFPISVDTFPNTTYWQTNPVSGTPLNTSLIAYAPETVWNDDQPNPNLTYVTDAGGGGVSAYETGPTWQAQGTVIGGITIPVVAANIGSKTKTVGKLLPDVSLQASVYEPGLIECSSDPDPYSGEVYVCTNTSFIDPTSGYINVGGGTSYSAPTFAGMVAVINQATNASGNGATTIVGQGAIGSDLWAVGAQGATVYASAFHDITVGANACEDFNFVSPGYPAPPAPMPAICGITSLAAGTAGEYQAIPGYDMASGLGSVDLLNLIKAWPKATNSTLIGTTTTLAGSVTSNASTNDVITITIASETGTTVPTGSVVLTLAGAATGVLAPTVATTTLVNGVATYTFNSAVIGTNILTATYSGDATHAPSYGILSISNGNTNAIVVLPFNLAVSDIIIKQGATGTTALVATPVGAFNGQLQFSYTTTATTKLNICLNASNLTIGNGLPATGTITIQTNIANCTTGSPLLRKVTVQATGLSGKAPRLPWKNAPVPVTIAGLLLVLCVRRRSSLLRAGVAVACVLTLSLSGIGLTGCSSASNAASTTTVTTCTTNCTTPTPVGTTPTGNYTIIVTGTDVASPTNTSFTTFNLTVD